ncbi:hypothetical protein CcaverHIS002_0605120 [Cutaneotrichosporon cavernicola]|uniref:RRM domain-containing protein n=1 Tax=Cutaneotrichosporon cavernicola TaxID=279322 RepID=A0AA48L8N7_9TREE|nr:uncharacterized protein CcaverHIS019_0604570 [Cutaneotrichosporon cavernicola]BEI86225.1 hypothetical protein CcaverHIS002_0605120 [Cutaneotrichosporon cavernicola]BEI93998.1 hypothetical protein CcaverHIS019_0604570 [Cutaneotrichosporon cavernicola]BEJ01778.1 hypothetical protein CcaverHIS631_0604600 [Cutaneotrichosporon cavernicola]BEJ09545.1 hypothetical protein CcaverHIS641_0604600 [Cutaneotrichosporon cavernicola]
MASMDIDKPLDEMIAAKPRGRRGGRGRGASSASAPSRDAAPRGAAGARARYSGSAPRNVSQTQRAAVVPAANKPVTADATKIIISNLPTDVTEAQVRDLMQSTVGPVRALHMAYTASGKSSGSATVIFKNRGDANKAHTTYHNRMIDNQRPMKVEIAIDPNAVASSLAARVATPRAAKPDSKSSAPRGRRAPPPSRPRAARPAKKSAEDLDAEMEAYKTTTA